MKSTLSSASTATLPDLTGDGIRTEADANYRRNMLTNIARGYEQKWLR